MNFLKYLKIWTPINGRFIRENGQTVNLADAIYELNAVDNQLSVVRGEVYQSSWRGTVLQGQSVYFAHPIEEGILARQIGTFLTYQGGPFEYTETISAEIGLTEETIAGHNGDRRLIATVSGSPILRVASSTGGIVVDRSFGESASSGANRQSNGLAIAGIGGYFDQNHYPVYRVQNTGSTTLQLAMDWVWKEIENA